MSGSQCLYKPAVMLFNDMNQLSESMNVELRRQNMCRIFENIPLYRPIWYIFISSDLRRSYVTVPAAHRPHSVWAPWLNLVQPGNRLLPYRHTNISILHSDQLVMGYYAHVISTPETHEQRWIDEFFFTLVAWPHKGFKDILSSFRLFFSRYPKCPLTMISETRKIHLSGMSF